MIILRNSLILALIVAPLVSCIPHRYEITFPQVDLVNFPDKTLKADSEILVIPLWRWIKTSERGYGPPIIVAPEDIGNLDEMIMPWRGTEVIRAFGHEGTKAPHPSGVLFVTDEGAAVRLNRRHGEWIWDSLVSAQIGPDLKSNLEAAFGTEPLSSAVSDSLFGYSYGEILGSEEELETARDFLSRLDAVGNDKWTKAALD